MKAHTVNNHKSAWNKFGKIGCESCENNDNLEGCNICDLKENSSDRNTALSEMN